MRRAAHPLYYLLLIYLFILAIVSELGYLAMIYLVNVGYLSFKGAQERSQHDINGSQQDEAFLHPRIHLRSPMHTARHQ